MDVPAEIRAARISHGLTQAALASRAGTSQANVSAYECGTRQPSLATLSRLLRACGKALDVGEAHPTVYLSDYEMRWRGEILSQVIQLAESLPYRPRELGRPIKERIADSR